VAERLKFSQIVREKPYTTAGLVLPVFATAGLCLNELAAGRAVAPNEVINTLAGLEGFIGIPVGVALEIIFDTVKSYQKRSR
jgi:hypothetical protein